MFTVPGWTIPAETLRTQVAVVGPDHTANARPDVGEVGQNKSKKRKRGHGKDTEVTGDNLGELWARYLEGKASVGEAGKGDVRERRKRKKSQRDDEQITGAEDAVQHRELLQNDVREAGKSTDSTNNRAAAISSSTEGISTQDHSIASAAPPEDDGGRAKYERRKAKAERKREQRAKKQASGELPPPRQEAPSEADSQSKALDKKASKAIANAAAADLTAKESNGFDLVQTIASTNRQPNTAATITVLPEATPSTTKTLTPTMKLTPLQAKMAAKLTSARFRHLNETLYTTPSSASLSLFTTNPAAYTAYHAGFRAQVAVWPSNPIDGFIEDVKSRGAVRGSGRSRGESRNGRDSKGSQAKAFRDQKQKKKKGNLELETRDEAEGGVAVNQPLPLPRSSSSKNNNICTIADLGCGDARLAGSLSSNESTSPSASERLGLRVLSFDLARGDGPYRDLVTVADTTDLKEIGVADGSVDVGVCCLSLMGTNWVRVVEECRRVVRVGGEVWVAEIRSRFRRKGEMVRTRREEVMAEEEEGGEKRKKKQQKKGGKKKGEQEYDGEGDDAAAAALALEEDLGHASSKANNASGRDDETDVSAFVAVWKKRGFALIGEPDFGNKMFVKMRFLRDKGAGSGGGDPGEGRFATSRAKMAAMNRGKKFVEKDADDEETMDGVDEGKVLKPCVYKTR